MTETLGHNSGDPHAIAFADVEARLDAFLAGGDVWDKRKPDDMTDDLAARANDFLAGARKLWKEADEARKAEKQPHLDASRDVEAKWKRLLDRAAKIADVVKPLLEAHLKRKQEAARKAAAEAERVRREAEEAKRRAEQEAANATTVREKIEAQERAQEAEAQAQHAAEAVDEHTSKQRVGSATGLANTRSLRTVREPRIDSLPQALAHYRDEPEIVETILRLAARDLRAAPVVSGVKQVPNIPGIAWVASEKV